MRPPTDVHYNILFQAGQFATLDSSVKRIFLCNFLYATLEGCKIERITAINRGDVGTFDPHFTTVILSATKGCKSLLMGKHEQIFHGLRRKEVHRAKLIAHACQIDLLAGVVS